MERGAYAGDNKKVIFVVIMRLEEIGNIHDIRGGRFKKNDIH